MTLVAKLRVYAFVLPFYFAGCGATLQEREATMQHQLCMAQAEAKALQEADRVCPPASIPWESCPDRQRILDSLEASYKECP